MPRRPADPDPISLPKPYRPASRRSLGKPIPQSRPLGSPFRSNASRHGSKPLLQVRRPRSLSTSVAPHCPTLATRQTGNHLNQTSRIEPRPSARDISCVVNRQHPRSPGSPAKRRLAAPQDHALAPALGQVPDDPQHRTLRFEPELPVDQLSENNLVQLVGLVRLRREHLNPPESPGASGRSIRMSPSSCQSARSSFFRPSRPNGRQDPSS
jgi:hypothetical protein